MYWNKGKLCWKIAKLFYFCHHKKLVRPETVGPYYIFQLTVILLSKRKVFETRLKWGICSLAKKDPNEFVFPLYLNEVNFFIVLLDTPRHFIDCVFFPLNPTITFPQLRVIFRLLVTSLYPNMLLMTYSVQHSSATKFTVDMLTYRHTHDNCNVY